MTFSKTALIATIVLFNNWALAGQLRLTCVLKDDRSTGVEILVKGEEFNNPSVDKVIGKIRAFKKGDDVLVATNASIDERLPVTLSEDGSLDTFWTANINLGRSGNAQMGFDPINNSWNLAINTMELRIPQKAGNAICAATDDSGMAH